MTSPKSFLAFVAGLLALGTTAFPAPGVIQAEGEQTLPPGYVDEQIGYVDSLATGLAMLPDGRLLISTQGGRLYMHKNGALLPDPVLNLTAPVRLVCSQFERGIESVAVDPNFAQNGYIYLYYTYAGSDATCTSSSPEINRVVRYTMNGDTPESPQVILNNIDSPAGNHNGGSLAFGADGLLYISTGDGAAHPEWSQNKQTLNGKILRINADGSIPSSNPYASEAGSVVCANAPVNPSGGTCREVFAYGLRNPFKTAFKPGTNDFYINDVGQSTWEEINVGAMGANYGWNVREGFCANGSASNCNTPNQPNGVVNNYTEPLYAYRHGSGLCSINGGAFTTDAWSAPYNDSYFFGDWCGNTIYRLVPPATAGGTWRPVTFYTSPVNDGILAMLFDPATRSMFYSQGNNGVRRIRYTNGGGTNRAPSAVASGSPTAGALPLTVAFSGSRSSDPDGGALTYGWRFGNGEFSDQANPSTTYTTAGVFTATLVVTDEQGLASMPARVMIQAGNRAPTATITAPAGPFRVGAPITLTVNATDPEDGALSDARLQWTVLLHHVPFANQITRHTHPYASSTGTTLANLRMPPPEDLDAAPLSYLEVQLTARDAQGVATTVTRTLQPARTTLGLGSTPDGVRIGVNNESRQAPATLTAWQGMTVTLSAPAMLTKTNDTYLVFNRWSNNGPALQTLTVSTTSLTYTVSYSEVVLSSKVMLPVVRR
jgi:glucose/arabinose dehydrogenase/PKD repeat protein